VSVVQGELEWVRFLGEMDASEQPEWPETYSPEAHQALVRLCTDRFLKLTSQEATSERACAVCGEDQQDTALFLPDAFPGLTDYLARNANTDDEAAGRAPLPSAVRSDRADPRLEYLQPSAYMNQRVPNMEATLTYNDPVSGEHIPGFDGLILDPVGFVQHQDMLHVCVCSGCSSPLRLGKLPPRAIANDNWLGAPAASSRTAKDFASLTWAELQLLALERTRIVLQLRGASIYSADMKQRGARGNAISHKHDTEQVCTLLPRPVDSLVEVLKVIFTSNRPMTDKDLKWAALVHLPKVVRCFQWLQENHPGYANIRLHHAYDDLDPGMLPFVPECVMVSATQLPDGGVADDAHANAGHGNAAGDSSDSDMHISPSAFSPAADSPVPMLPVDDTQQPDSDDDSDIVVDEMGRVWTRDSHGRLSAPNTKCKLHFSSMLSGDESSTPSTLPASANEDSHDPLRDGHSTAEDSDGGSDVEDCDTLPPPAIYLNGVVDMDVLAATTDQIQTAAIGNLVKGVPTLNIPHSDEPVSRFKDPLAWSRAHPSLYPRGLGTPRSTPSIRPTPRILAYGAPS
jgi:hypothetical protein